MAKELVTVPVGATKFKGYDKPRFTKSKEYRNATLTIDKRQFIEICSNCHMPWGGHFGIEDCPTHQIIKFT
jgi:hypothetical protein